MVSMDRKEASYRGADLKLFVRDVRDSQSKKIPITVRSWSTIKDVKDVIRSVIQVPLSAQRLYFGPLLTSGGELPNHRTLHDAGIYRSGETLLLDIQRTAPYCPPESPFSSMHSLRSSSSVNDICISSCMIDSTPRFLRLLVQDARRGFALGLKPDLVLDGSGGTYFLHDARKNKIAVFKPADEEPYAENNPRGYLPQPGEVVSMREGIVPGEACIREVAAFLLDHDGFSGVPCTTLVEARHPAFNSNGSRLKVSEGGASIGSHSISPSPSSSCAPKKAGSLQEFVKCDFSMDDISPSKISVEEVHKIAILDIRLMNADRNSANLLCRRREDNSLELVPIDHGYCLRSVCNVSWMDWCWLDWPQLKEPVSAKFKKYIEKLDIEEDARMLRERLNICEQAVDYFRASSSILKAGVKAGLTLYEIAIMCCRNDNLGEVPSKLEMLGDMASELAIIALENERWHHTAASRALVEQLTPHRVSFDVNSFKGSRRKSCAGHEFTSYSSDSFGSDFDDVFVKTMANRDAPGMASASSSDSSTDTGDALEEKEEKDECEEWAATVIADVTEVLPATRRAGRSDSLSSDDGSSDGAQGFWHVAPGASDVLGASDDEGSTCWSPQGSPRGSVDSIGLCANIPEPPLSLSAGANFKSPRVSFALPLEQSFGPPRTVNVSTFKSKPLGLGSGTLELPFRPPQMVISNATMTRSKSYSALSRAASSSSSDDGTTTKREIKPHAEEYQHYRNYFLKFIDLVIAREMTAAKALGNKKVEVTSG